MTRQQEKACELLEAYLRKNFPEAYSPSHTNYYGPSMTAKDANGDIVPIEILMRDPTDLRGIWDVNTKTGECKKR